MMTTAQNDPSPEKQKSDTHLDGFVRDLKVFDGLSDSSVALYRRLVQEFFTWLTGNADFRHVDQLGHQDVEAYLTWCYYPVSGVRRGNGNQTRRTKLIALHRYARFLRRQGIIPADRDFTKDIPKPKIKKRSIPIFSPEEHEAFFRAIDPKKEKGLRDAVIFILAGFCGLRAGEIASLRMEHIQDGRGPKSNWIDVHVPDDIACQRGRGSEGRIVDLWAAPSRDVRRYVALRLKQGAGAESPFLVPYLHKRAGTGPLNDCDLDWIIKHYAELAGIRKTRISMHMFRATHADNLLAVEGYHIRAIASRLGHASIATTDRYLSNQHRITKKYPSLAARYRWYEKVWDNPKTEGGADGGKQPLE